MQSIQNNTQTSTYQVHTPVYDGPMDLLLQLIERAELDITRLALAQVTDQYLAHMKLLQEQEYEEVSVFIVIAARLLQIKSEALLPRPIIREAGEEDPGEALARQLIAYKRYRQIADLLERREDQGYRTYLRLAPPPHIEGKIDLSEVGLPDLFRAAQNIFFMTKPETNNTIVRTPRITIKEKINHIAKILRTNPLSTFSILIAEKRSRLDIVVTFLAVLELIKRQLIQARQDSIFGEIALERSNDWQMEEDIEIEFIE